MKLADTILTALQNLGRRKVRTLLTSIGVFVGILTIVTMVSLGVGIQKQITDTIKAFGLETVWVGPRIERQPTGANNPFARPRPEKPITPAVVEQLTNLDGVASYEVWLEIPAAPEMTLNIDGKTFPIVLRERDPADRVFSAQQEMAAGEKLPDTADAKGLVLSQRLLRGAGYSSDEYASLVGKPATVSVTAPRGDKADFKTTVAGVSDGFFGVEMGNADKLEIKKWWFNDPNTLETDGYSAVVLHTETLNDATRVSREVEDNLGLESSTLQIFLDQVNRIFAILQVMLSSVGLLALLVASIGIINTMIMAIYERTREIGILKAVGSSNGDVLRMFMFEAGMIGLLGGIVGVLAGWGLGLLLNVIIIDYMKREQIPMLMEAPFFVVTWELVGGALVFATLVGILAGLYPAFRAARLDPLAALRHE
jgi:putative ABC transport system permease protein